MVWGSVNSPLKELEEQGKTYEYMYLEFAQYSSSSSSSSTSIIIIQYYLCVT